MSFHNVKLPDDIDYGQDAGPTFATVIQETASGHEYRISRRAQGRHDYRCSKELLTDVQRATLKDFWIGRRGHEHSFRFKGWDDYTTGTSGTGAPSATDNVLGTGDGTTQTFQLIKDYDLSGPAPYARTLTLPVAGTVLAALDGTPSVAFSLTNPGGVLTFSSPPGAGVVVSAGCEFDIPVRFNVRDERWAMVARNFDLNDADFNVLEVLDEVEWPELRYAGGSLAGDYVAISFDQSFTAGVLVHPWNPTGSLKAFLPAADRFEGGEQFIMLIKSGASGTVQVYDHDGNTVGSAKGSATATRLAFIRDTVTGVWVAY